MDYPKRLSKDMPRLLQAFREYEGPSSSDVNDIIDDLKKVNDNWNVMEAIFIDEQEEENMGNTSITTREFKLRWLRELKDLAWKMDGLMDIYNYKLVEIQLEEAKTDKGMKKKGKSPVADASSVERVKMHVKKRRRYMENKGIKKQGVPGEASKAISSPLDDAFFRQEIAEHVRMINEQYKMIYKKNKALMQVSNSEKQVPSRKMKRSEWREPTGHLPVDSHQFLGRKEELSRLKEMLNCSIDHVGDHTVEVIAVVGMGGVGKTTLAQHAYKAANEDKDLFGFDKMGWVFTSEDLGFDVLRLTKAAIDSFGAASSSSDQLSVHQNDLICIIKGNRFLLVVDDLWKISNWEKFLAPFVQGGAKKGSRILVTTRSQDVAKVVLEKHSKLHIDLDCLSEIDGWSLLKEIIFGSGNELATAEQNKELIAIGKEIAQKCKGLPLAIKMTGNLLRQVGEDDKEKWMQIRDSGLWDQHLEDNSEKKRMVLGSLRLSYAYMPPDLRVFFKSLSMLSKGEEISRERLISIWMIYGALDYSSEEDVSRINADNIINDLVSWAFLIKRVSFLYFHGSETRFEMHDLIHDLALEVCGEEFKAEEIKSAYSPDSKARIMSIKLSSQQQLVVHATRVRLLSVSTYRTKVLRISDVECLRSLCLDGFKEIHWNQDCIEKMKHLHVLKYRNAEFREWTVAPGWIFHQYNLHSLCISRVKSIPNAIGDLKNLRFLKMEYIADGRIPEAVYTLINLRVLMILRTDVMIVSESISSLVNLQELQIKSYFLKELPRGVTELTQLRLMSLLPDGAFLPTGISKMTKLRQLSTFKLCDCSLRTEKCSHAGLDEMEKLNISNRELCIFNFRYAKTQDVQARTILSIMKNLHMLNLHWGDDTRESSESQNNTRSLFINYFPVNIFQSWMGDPSLNRLVKIRISYSSMCTLSPLAQLPSLKSLKIQGDIHFDIADSQTEGCSTRISDQSQRPFFPELQILSVWDCPSLRVIPLYKFKKLSYIYINGCENFNEIELEGGLSGTPDGESSPPIHLAIAECDGPRLTPEMQKGIKVSHCSSLSHLAEREHSLSHCSSLSDLAEREHTLSHCSSLSDLAEREHSLSGDLFIPAHPHTRLQFLWSPR